MKQLIKKFWVTVLFGGFVTTLGLGAYIATTAPIWQIGTLNIDMTLPFLILIMIVFSILASYALSASESVDNEPVVKPSKIKKKPVLKFVTT